MRINNLKVIHVNGVFAGADIDHYVFDSERVAFFRVGGCDAGYGEDFLAVNGKLGGGFTVVFDNPLLEFGGINLDVLLYIHVCTCLLGNGKKGVVSDPKTHEDVIRSIVEFVPTLGWHTAALDFSPITGPEGNIEFLADLQPGPGEIPTDEMIAEVVARAHREHRR